MFSPRCKSFQAIGVTILIHRCKPKRVRQLYQCCFRRELYDLRDFLLELKVAVKKDIHVAQYRSSSRRGKTLCNTPLPKFSRAAPPHVATSSSKGLGKTFEAAEASTYLSPLAPVSLAVLDTSGAVGALYGGDEQGEECGETKKASKQHKELEFNGETLRRAVLRSYWAASQASVLGHS